MVGIFSKFSRSKTTSRSSSLLDERVVLQPNIEEAEVDNVVASGVTHGIEVMVEFKPLEHPTEPLDNDKPVDCPLPEPSLLNDGRLWKERISAANERRKADLPALNQGPAGDSSRSNASQPGQSNRMILSSLSASEPGQSNQMILSSLSASESDIVNLLDESNSSAV